MSGGGKISFVEPISRAITHTSELLFKPFDIGKWFVIGFAAWLATFGESAPGYFNFQIPSSSNEECNPQAVIESLKQLTAEHLLLMLCIAFLVIGFVLALGILITWLSARGQFMFLDNAVRNRAEIARPWTRFAKRGNSLFLWLLAFDVATLLLTVALVAGLIATCVPMCSQSSALAMGVTILALLVILLLVFIIAASYVLLFLKDFVVPIMYLKDLTVLPAWREFSHLFKAQPGLFFLYGLVRFLIALVVNGFVSAIVLAACLCCCIGLVFYVPYVGAVLLLPFTAFVRFYSVDFLAQFGKEYNCFMQTAMQ